MGGFAARKALTVVEHVEAVLAMELMAACQGMEFLKPLISTAPLNKVYQLVRSVSAPLTEDRFMQPEIEAVTQLLRDNKVSLFRLMLKMAQSANNTMFFLYENVTSSAKGFLCGYLTLIEVVLLNRHKNKVPVRKK
ncbi:hypothetical protein OESDEN_19238 [Oesophagostomum dentatum]|uniref:Uncharacterized protein n=1 Tax=Oesophagostomum dentatum TaxID=61180 RepID=A0A0B1S6W4_OESDE|nr:hypothetical protein OESDEN_19238 [Oesophagostomum dentatum]